MKIGFIEPGVHICGGIRRILEVSNYLVDFGHDVFLFTPTGKPSGWIKNKAKIQKLSKLENHRFDVVIFNLANQYKAALAAKAKTKVFWVLAPEAMYKHPAVPIYALNQPFFLVTNSSFTRGYILDNLQRKINYSIPIIPGGINPNHFKYDPLIKKYYHVLYYGSARPWKGSDLIRHAVSGLGIKGLSMEGTNTSQHEMYKLYNKSTIFVSACLREGFNMPILEAFACGCPVICTDDGGNRDFVRDRYNALVVKRDIASIKRGISTLLSNKNLRKHLRKNGLKEASKDKYEWGNIARQFENVIIEFSKKV